MKNIEFIRIPLLKEGHFALLPYDSTERELLGKDEFLELLDAKIMMHLSELTTKAVKEEE